MVQCGSSKTAGIAVTLQHYIWEVLGSKRGRDTVYPDMTAHGFPQSIQGNAENSSIKHKRSLQNHSQTTIQRRSKYLMLHSQDVKSVAK
jgi:hypothetical protein